jgi:hypothetical protein
MGCALGAPIIEIDGHVLARVDESCVNDSFIMNA